ncbi:putative transcription factor [Sesamum alatum]|uniref:Transcription factor n=1 Tax=Sesamum alatum TaxID=300844 RepID=A0AAE1YMT2_9LAMI|nr:putative transcription factor [Sesamum alatum]
MSASFHSALTHLAKLKLTEQAFMDSIFVLGQADRAVFLRHMTQSFGCSYICLWSYLPLPSNCLLFLDGIYQEESSRQHAGPSSGSLARRLFNAYSESVNYVDDQGRVPGFAFKNNLPYMEVKLHGLQRRLSNEMQMQFYQEAGIKIVVFMGCASGEIELGISSEPQADLEMEIKSWFPVDFSRQKAPTELPQPTSQDRPSTSSSSLRSLSVDSSEYSLLFNVQTSSFITETPQEAGPALISTSPHQQAENALSQIRNIQFPTIERENAAMTKAILAVLSSPSTSSSSHTNLPPVSPAGSHEPAAFRRYRSGLAPIAATSHKHSMFKRSILFFRNLNMRRRQELQIQGNRPTSTQLQHMISERRRREKLNESFQVLRSLLPPGSKKDKASVLSSTTEYISSLKSQVEELSKRNQVLQSELSTTGRKEGGEEVGGLCSSSERASVEIAHVSSASTSEEARFLELRVRLRSGECSLLDLVIRVLEFLNQQSNVRLLSVQSNTRLLESAPVHGLVLRLRVEGDEFEECGFQEAVRRVVDDLPH